MSNITNIFPELQQVLQKLSFIGKIKEGQRLNVNYRPAIVGGNSWLYSFYESFIRSMNGEGRESTIAYLKELMSETLHLLEKYQTMQQLCYLTHILEMLKEAKQGIKNLKITYYADPLVVSQLDVILLQMQDQLVKYSHGITNPIVIPDSSSAAISIPYGYSPLSSSAPTVNNLSYFKSTPPTMPSQINQSPPTILKTEKEDDNVVDFTSILNITPN